MLTFEAPADSLAFGRAETALEGLMFVSHNAGAVADTGVAAAGSELTMVDMATLRRVANATDGSRGDLVTTTSAGPLTLPQSNQIDSTAPATAPRGLAPHHNRTTVW